MEPPKKAKTRKVCIKCQMLYQELNLIKLQQENIMKMLEAMERTGGEVGDSVWCNAKERNLVLRGMNMFVLNLLKSL